MSNNFLFRFYPLRVTNSASKNRAYDNIFNDSKMNCIQVCPFPESEPEADH